MSVLAEMYVQGVSTRKVKASTISRINAGLDGVLSRFAERRLEKLAYCTPLEAREQYELRHSA